jgi:hypothetical protein
MNRPQFRFLKLEFLKDSTDYEKQISLTIQTCREPRGERYGKRGSNSARGQGGREWRY